MTISKASSRSESVKKLRNEILEQQRVLAEQQARRDKQRDEREKFLAEQQEQRERQRDEQ